jgi:hypothetical protein
MQGSISLAQNARTESQGMEEPWAAAERPQGHDHIYERNWNKIERSDRAVALLRWAAFALRPLTIEEVTEAVLINEDCETLPMHELPDAIDDEYIGSEILEYHLTRDAHRQVVSHVSDRRSVRVNLGLIGQW